MTLSHDDSKPLSPLTAGIDPRKPASLLDKFWFFLTLRPYGNDLLTRNGRSYLLAMSLITLLVALAEAFSWGYLASTMNRQNIFIGWIGFGIFVFILMWFFDRSLMTSDLLEAEHDLKLNPHTAPSQVTSPLSLKPTSWKKHLSFVIRITLALGSLWITAPYVSQLFFSADIENRIAKRYQLSIDNYKDELSRTANAKIEALQKSIEKLNQDVQNEAGGLNGTRTTGYGARSKLIDRQLTDQKKELEKTLNMRELKIAQIEQSYDQKDYDALRAQGIPLDMDSPMLRNEIVAEMEKEPAFWQTETAIRVFLGIMAAILLIMKILQPRVLKLYFSNHLQERWNQYCLGRYDQYLPEMDRRHVLMNAHDGVPETFEHIMIDLSKQQAQHEQEERDNRDAEEAARRAAADAEQQRQTAMAQANTAYFSRLATEQSLLEHQERNREFLQNQYASTLDDLQTIETDYLHRHGERLEQIKFLQEQQEQKVHGIETEFKTHAERAEARRRRIQDAERELDETEALLRQTRQREDGDRINVLRMIDGMEKALLRQKERMNNQRAELMGFEMAQKCVDDNRLREQDLLRKYREESELLQAPLDQANRYRLQIEAHRMQQAGEQGIMDAPFEPFSHQEMPLMIEQLRQRMDKTPLSLA
jgi:hypothetical protein